MTRTWEDRGWPYLPALVLALGPFLVFGARLAVGSPAGWREVQAWAWVVAGGAIAAHGYLVVTMTLSGIWATTRGGASWLHALGIAAVQLVAGSLLFLMGAPEDAAPWVRLLYLLDPQGWLALSLLSGGAVVLAAIMVGRSCARYRRGEARPSMDIPVA